MHRRTFIQAAVAAAAQDTNALYPQIDKQYDGSLKRLQAWVRQPSVAAENRGMKEGCELMMSLVREAGFTDVKKVESKGQPAVFAVLDAGAPRTVGIYFMYDVKQADPSEWTSPPWDAAIVDRPLGKVLMGRGSTNQKGPQSTLLSALHAFKAAGRTLPVNLAFIAEGEEEIGSPHFPDIMRDSDVNAAFRRCSAVYMPMPLQDPDGEMTLTLGAKGVIEVELVASGERWGRGPTKEIHSAFEAQIDSPAWHLVQALASLVGPDGHTPAIEGFADRARPISADEKRMVRELAKRLNEQRMKQMLGISHWVHDVDFVEALELLASRPTINIEGLVGGYTGPGGKTILPHRAVAKLDLRLVPDMTAAGALDALRAHFAKRGFGDIEVTMTGGYDPTSTSRESVLVRAETALLKRYGIDPMLSPRLAGSWPGYVFTGPPLKVPANHFGVGHGGRAHAPDEYFVLEPKNPKIRNYHDAIRSQVDFLFELASAS